MTKKTLKTLIAFFFILCFVLTVVFLIVKAKKNPQPFPTESPVPMDIVQKIIATGQIVPEKEIKIKSRVPGIVDKLHIKPGDRVRFGDLLAAISVVPSAMELNRAQTDLLKAERVFEEAEREFKKREELLSRNIISKAEYQKYFKEYDLAKMDLESAENNLLILKKGGSQKTGPAANLIYATAFGTILDLPVKPGDSVIESNTFNEGTTITVIADMRRLIFQGMVNESEIGKIKTGMDIDLIIAALEQERFKAKLDFIAPKGNSKDGSMQFEIRAGLSAHDGETLRAGYSANAEIVTAKVEKVLAIQERNLLFEGAKTFVEVETAPGVFQKREIVTGLSDGIHIEVKSGLAIADKIKVQSLKQKFL